MADGSIRINCDIDINKASKSIDELMSKLNNFKSKAIELKVSADFSEINSQLENFQGLVKRAYSDGIVLTVRGTFDTINEQLENFQDLAERAYSDGINLKIRGDFSSFKSELEELKTLTENFELNQSIKIPFEVTPKTEGDDIGEGAFVQGIIGLISKNNEVFSRHPLVVPIIAKGANSGGTKEFLENSKDYKKLADNIAYFINTVPVGNKLQDVADSLVGFTEKFNTLNISGETIKSLRTLAPALDGLSEIPELSGVGENLNVLFRQLSTSQAVNGEAILQTSKAIRVLSEIEKLPQDFSVLEQTGKNIHAFSNDISVINLQDDVLKSIGRIVSSVNLLSKANEVQEDFSNLPKISSNIETYAMNLTGISMDENVMKSIQVIVSSIRSLSNIQKLPENLGSLPDIGNYINLFSNSIDSLNTTEDNVKILRTVISCIRSLASISKLPEGLETLVADGEYIVKFANSISSIEISDIASKNINLITNVLRVISSWQTKELNLEKTSKELLTFSKSLAQLNFGNTIEESQQVSKNIDVLAKAMNAYSSMTSSMSKKSGELDLKPAAEQIKTFIESLTKLENPNNILGSIATIINGLNTVSNTSNKLSNVATNANKGTKAFGIMNKGLSRLSSGLKGALGKFVSFLSVFKRMLPLANSISSSLNGVSSSIKNSATELLSKVRLIKGSITTLISIFNNLSSAYEDQISAETRFEVSIKNSSDATKDQIKEIKDLTSNYQKLGILGDEVQLTGLQELSTYVENAESVKKLLPVMNDMVAQQFGFNATTENAFTVATALGKVLNGNTDTLKRYGYFFDDTQKKILQYGTEEQRVAVLTNVVSSAVGGMNNAMLNTPTGRIVQLKNYFGDLKESLGELLNFAILPLVDGIKTVIINLNLAVKSFTTFIKSSLGIKTVAHDIKSVLDVNKNKTSRSVSDTADSLGYLNDSANKAKKSVKNLLSPLDELNILSDSTSDSIVDASGYLDDLSLGQGLSETIEIPNLNDLKKKLKDLLGSVSSFDKLGTTLGLKFNTFVSKLKPEKLASQLAGFINDAVALASSFLGTADFAKLGQKIASFLNTFLFKLDTSKIGKLFAQNLNAIINFARGIITNFDFKLLGEKIAGLINEFVLTFDPENAAKLLLDCLSGALTLLTSLLSNLDFASLGTAIAKFFTTIFTNLPIGDLASTLLGDILGNTLTIIENIITAIANIATNFKNAWDDGTGNEILNGLLKLLVDISSAISGITADFAEWSKSINFKPLLNSLNKILTPLRELTGTILNGLRSFISDFVEPISKWVIEDELPEGIDTLSSALSALNDIFVSLSPIFKSFYDNILTPIGEWSADNVSNALSKVQEILGDVGTKVSEIFTKLQPFFDWLFETLGPPLQTLLDGMQEVLSGVLSTIGDKINLFLDILSGVIDFITDVFSGNWDKAWEDVKNIFIKLWNYFTSIISNFCTIALGVLKARFGPILTFFSGIWDKIKGVFSGVTKWFGDLFINAWKSITKAFDDVKQFFDNILTDIHNVFIGIGTWFGDRFNEAWNGITGAFNTVKKFFSDRLNDIKDTFKGIGTWFKEKFDDAWSKIKGAFNTVGTFFGGLYNTIKSKFTDFGSKIGTAVGTAFKGAINGALTVIEGALNLIPNAINGALDVINKIPGVNIQHMSTVQLPRLAKGGLAYAPTLAVVGDNRGARSDPEVIAPLSRLLDIISDGLNTRGIIKVLESISSKMPSYNGINSYKGLPQLATGAVIKPNNEFMAILGDQKRGINIETPLETMKQAFTEALNEGNYGLGDITIPVYIGNKQLDTIILESNSRRTIRSNGRG